MKTKTILAAWIVVGTMCAGLQATTAARQPTSFPIDQNDTGESLTLMRVAMVNSFAGRYCGYLVGQNHGYLSIADSGDVSGYFSYTSPTFSESFKLSGRVNSDGVMRLNVTYSHSVRGRRGTSSQRYSITVNVALDESGNLAATSGASFVLSPCP